MSFYFTRTGDDAYRATELVAGAWNPDEQHISPVLGLLVHLLETDHAARREASGAPRLQLGRISADIFGVVPVDEFTYDLRVLRPGRSIELAEAELRYGGRTIVLLRAWFVQAADTAGLAGSPFVPIPSVDETPEFDSTTVWPGAYIASFEARRTQVEPGHAHFWLRTPVDLVDDARASALARAAGLFDTANGMTVRRDPREVAFPNVELTASLFRQPFAPAAGTGPDTQKPSRESPWLGFNTRVSFGPTGLGLTSSVLHDQDGPFGTLNQTLTVRP
ncbi:thioesterase family protein [Brevibacterium sp. 50QC2O2]|uniref:thioesterase family protein n=1 Tax=Brevibacterium TaxID=1696 RepID=UPI00211C73D4|nr:MULTISPECIES: thioesterase family protein [unclassified Brevibacterium]MCQ9385283.1 thioesterase family protein [Brevibacterium sp. 68QC2CO]MCQ9388789.1 thioesterase family protein [Brevibacterium sp. 50QC2O2]